VIYPFYEWKGTNKNVRESNNFVSNFLFKRA